MAQLGVADFIKIAKRESRYGLVGTTGDQATTDVLNELNIRRKRIWAYWNWKWALEKLSFAIAINTTQYTVAAASGNPIDRITDLIPQDSTVTPAVWAAPLQELERQDFYSWWAAQPSDSADIPAKYVNLGMDANQAWLIEVAPKPSQAFTMKGFAKKKLATYTAADITANTLMDYFPDGVVETVLLDAVLSGIFHIQGMDAVAAQIDAEMNRELLQMKTEQDMADKDDSGIVTKPPPSMIWKRRSRSKFGTGTF